MNWLDWVLLLIIAFSAIRGFQKGLLASLTRVLGQISGLAVAFTGRRPVADYVDEQWGLKEQIAEIIRQRVYEQWQAPEAACAGQQFLANSLNTMSNQLAMNLLEILAFIIIFLLVSLVVRICTSFFSKMFARTLFRPLDKLGGLGLGLARGLLIVVVIAIVIEPLQVLELFSGPEIHGYSVGSAFSDSLLLPLIFELLKTLSLQLAG